MKNRKGFTLIELIAAVIILGLVLIIAIPFFTGSLKQFRTDYYEGLSGNVLNAGKEFFTDNRLYLPHKYLESAIVKMETLENENYLDKVKDYNGSVCDARESYVIAIRVSKDEVIYDSCIRCSDDNYDNTEGKKTCSPGWREGEGFTMMEYNNPEKVYVYKGTSRSDLKDKLLLYPKIIRCRGKAGICEEELKWVSGEGEEGVVPLQPIDIEAVNTGKVGTYVVHYKYENYADLINRDVIVYEHTGVTVSAKKYNDKYENTIFNKVEKVESNYDLTATNRDDWAQQKIIFTFNHSFGNDTPNGLYVTHYQILLNNRWEDYCDPKKGSNYCAKEETRQMDEKVQFRLVDSLGNIGTPSEYMGIRMEKGVPTCTVVESGTKGSNDWYISDVNISFKSKEDVAGSVPYSGATAPLSGILQSGITQEEKLPNQSGKQTTDGKNIKWYGYVEDKANNLGKCSVTFNRDVEAPTCSITGHANLKATDETSGISKVYWSQTNNQTNNAILVDNKNSWTNTPTVSKEGRWYLRVFDEAGWECQTNSMYCKITYDPNGGTTPKKGSTTKTSEILRETEKVDLSVKSTKSGYTFEGWNLKATDTTGLKEFVVREEEKRTLYAIFVILDPTGLGLSAFEPGGGMNGPITKIYGSSSTTLTCSQTREYAAGTELYYSFGYSTTDGGTPGHWTTPSTTNTYTIGATDYYGDRYYSCRIYAKNNIDNETSNTVEIGNKLIRYNNARITFYANGGSVNGKNPVYVRTGNASAFTEIRNSTTTALPTGSKSCYTLNGWYTDKTEGSKVLNSNSTFTGTAVDGFTSTNKWAAVENKELFAQWTPNTYTISYDYAGGTPTSFTYGVGAKVTGTASRNGYTFNGWQYNSKKAYSHEVSTTACSNQSVTALWCKNCDSPVSHGTCSLDVAVAGTCNYTTTCDNDYKMVSGNKTSSPKCCKRCDTVDHGTCSEKWDGTKCAYDTTCDEGYDYESGKGTYHPVCKKFAKITCLNPLYNEKPQTIATCTGGTIGNAVQTGVNTYTVTCTGVGEYVSSTKKCQVLEAAATNTVNGVVTGYATLQEAFDASTKGNVKLLKDVEENITIASSIKKDFYNAGHHITGTFTNNGTLTVHGGGKILSYGTVVTNYGNLELTGGYYGYSSSETTKGIQNYGTLKLVQAQVYGRIGVKNEGSSTVTASYYTKIESDDIAYINTNASATTNFDFVELLGKKYLIKNSSTIPMFCYNCGFDHVGKYVISGNVEVMNIYSITGDPYYQAYYFGDNVSTARFEFSIDGTNYTDLGLTHYDNPDEYTNLGKYVNLHKSEYEAKFGTLEPNKTIYTKFIHGSQVNVRAWEWGNTG